MKQIGALLSIVWILFFYNNLSAQQVWNTCKPQTQHTGILTTLTKKSSINNQCQVNEILISEEHQEQHTHQRYRVQAQYTFETQQAYRDCDNRVMVPVKIWSERAERFRELVWGLGAVTSIRHNLGRPLVGNYGLTEVSAKVIEAIKANRDIFAGPNYKQINFYAASLRPLISIQTYDETNRGMAQSPAYQQLIQKLSEAQPLDIIGLNEEALLGEAPVAEELYDECLVMQKAAINKPINEKIRGRRFSFSTDGRMQIYVESDLYDSSQVGTKAYYFFPRRENLSEKSIDENSQQIIMPNGSILTLSANSEDEHTELNIEAFTDLDHQQLVTLNQNPLASIGLKTNSGIVLELPTAIGRSASPVLNNQSGAQVPSNSLVTFRDSSGRECKVTANKVFNYVDSWGQIQKVNIRSSTNTSIKFKFNDLELREFLENQCLIDVMSL